MTPNEDALMCAGLLDREGHNQYHTQAAAHIRRLVQENRALKAESGAESFVQPVPDRCDRIVWRNRYYHLPPAPHGLKPLTVEQIKLAADEAFAIVAKMPDEEVTGETWDEQFARSVERAHGIVEQSPPQAPFCWYDGRKFYGSTEAAALDLADMTKLVPLYASPQQPEPQPLTEEIVREGHDQFCPGTPTPMTRSIWSVAVRWTEQTHGIVEPPSVQSCGYESCDCRSYCKREGS